MAENERVRLVVARLRRRRKWAKTLIRIGLPFLAVGLPVMGFARGALQYLGFGLFAIGFLAFAPGILLWLFSEKV